MAHSAKKREFSFPQNTATYSNLNYLKLKEGYAGAPLLKKYTYRITEAVKKTIRGTVADDPVAKQYIPQEAELKILPEENPDPIGDHLHSPVKGIVHRYPDRVLYKIANICAVYCRYCFRRDMVGPDAGILKSEERKDALDYIRSDKNIWEVILTGGDPLVLSPRQIKNTLSDLSIIDHVQCIRIHTRVPIVDPKKITKDLCASLSNEKPMYVVIHINHVQEITKDVECALKDLQNSGCMLLSQSVLLKGINDDVQTLENLFRRLIALKIKPYYLHHPDLAPGTSHFRVSIKTGQKIMKDLQGHLSGICLPHYMLDIPGGHGKVPLTPCYLEELKNGTYKIEDPDGKKHPYPPITSSQ